MAHVGKPERYQSARIAGWEDKRGKWHNLEKQPKPFPRSEQLERSRNITIAVEIIGDDGEPSGELEYYQTGYLSPYLTIDDVVDQFQRRYEQEFV